MCVKQDSQRLTEAPLVVIHQRFFTNKITIQEKTVPVIIKRHLESRDIQNRINIMVQDKAGSKKKKCTKKKKNLRNNGKQKGNTQTGSGYSR